MIAMIPLEPAPAISYRDPVPVSVSWLHLFSSRVYMSSAAGVFKKCQRKKFPSKHSELFIFKNTIKLCIQIKKTVNRLIGNVSVQLGPSSGQIKVK